MSVPVGASYPSPLSLHLERSYSAPLCSSTTRWTRGHGTHLGSPECLSLRGSVGAVSVAHSASTLSARQRRAGLSRFISLLPVLSLSFPTSAGVSSSAHAIEMLTSQSCHIKSPNQALEPTVARIAFSFVLIDRLRLNDARSGQPSLSLISLDL